MGHPGLPDLSDVSKIPKLLVQVTQASAAAARCLRDCKSNGATPHIELSPNMVRSNLPAGEIDGWQQVLWSQG